MDRIIVLDFGSQYTHLIAKRVRKLGVYSEVMSPQTSLNDLSKVEGLEGIILSGGPNSVYDEDSPKCSPGVLELDVPVLGICYGLQLIAHLEGGKVEPERREYSVARMKRISESRLLQGLDKIENVWMSHGDFVSELPQDYKITASTESSPITVMENDKKPIYGVQFHPEVDHTPKGGKVLENFLYRICKARKSWTIENFIENATDEAKNIIGKRRAVIALSGGVDSSTAAVLLDNAGLDLVAVYVDTGMMRYRETDFIIRIFSKYNLDLRVVDAQERFFRKLKGVTEPEKKRKIIGREFIRVFSKVAKQVGADVLVQGTIYPDRIESGKTEHADVIKSHHNVGALPERMKLEVHEPMRDLYKDEVREAAKELGLPNYLVRRHPFPGPGNAVRINGEVTREKVSIVQRGTQIVENELRKAGWYDKVWMGFVSLPGVKYVGVQGDKRTYKYILNLHIDESENAMTANFFRCPDEWKDMVSRRLTNEIPEINSVFYKITNKPPGTMEPE